MTAIDRRRWLAAAGALILAPDAVAAETRMYDYLFLDLDAAPGAPPSRAFGEHVRGAGLEKAGGTPLGLFTSQIGWHARQAALLVGWAPGAAGRDAAMAAGATLFLEKPIRTKQLREIVNRFLSSTPTIA